MSKLRLSASFLLVLTGTGCRALLEGGELTLEETSSEGGGRGEGGSSGEGASSGEGGSTPTSSATGMPTTTTGATGTSTTVGGSTNASSASSGGGGADPGCGDGVLTGDEQCDDDGNEDHDGCDSECRFEGTQCDAPIAFSLGVGETRTFSMTNAEGAVAWCGYDGPARFFALTPTTNGFVSVYRPGRVGADLALATGDEACGNGFNYCSNGSEPASGEVLSGRVFTGEPYLFAVAGVNPADVGDVELQVTMHAGTCDDPVVIPVEYRSSTNFSGDTSGMSDDSEAPCGGGGPDVVYRLDGAEGEDLTGSISESGSNFNLVIYAGSSCGIADATCTNETQVDQSEELDFTAAPSGPTYLVVDGEGQGPYSGLLFWLN